MSYPLLCSGLIYTPLSHTGNEDPAHAREAQQGSSTGKASTSSPADEPGIEFVELRQFYSENFRDEGHMKGFSEYRQARAGSHWPGFSRLYEHLKACLDYGKWEKGFAPGLASYLRERMWLDSPKPRAAPNADGGMPSKEEVMRELEKVNAWDAKIKALANGGTA